MNKQEITTLSIVGGALIAAIYLINQVNEESSPIGSGIGSGVNNFGTYVGYGAEALGIGGGAAFLLWAFGNFIFPGL
jgi:hypothetical protein